MRLDTAWNRYVTVLLRDDQARKAGLLSVLPLERAADNHSHLPVPTAPNKTMEVSALMGLLGKQHHVSEGRAQCRRGRSSSSALHILVLVHR